MGWRICDYDYDCEIFRSKVAACAKHYVGDGGTNKGINENNTIISRAGLLSIHMPPYYNAIIKGVSTVMISYSSWNGVKMHTNHDLITNYLKNTLKFRVSTLSWYYGQDLELIRLIYEVLLYCVTWIGYNQQFHALFQGFVISDWQGIDRITTPQGVNYTNSLRAGVHAGIDMVSLS